jgi:DNA-binding response OmpR family regulator
MGRAALIQDHNALRTSSRALIIQDSAPLRTSYAEYLLEKGLDVYTAHGAADALALLPAVKPNVTVLDLDIRESDGFDLIKPICQSGSLCMILSARDAREDRINALSIGADDYIMKPVDIEELFLRLRNMLMHRQGPPSQQQSTILDLQGVRVDLMTRAILGPDDSPGAELTSTELTFLRILTDNFERVVSKEALFSAIRGEVYSPTTRSLDVGMSRLRIKLRQSSAGVDIRSVRQAGYLLARAVGARTTRQEI